MIQTRFAMVALILGCISAPIGLGAEPAAVQGAEGTYDLAWVEKRIQELQPTSAERRFDEIAWAGNICEALRLAREQGRAVFYFTHDGRMASGRC